MGGGTRLALAAGCMVLALAGAAGAHAARCVLERKSAAALLAGLEQTVSAQGRAAAERHAANPGPGISAAKAWGDFAAGAALAGDMRLAAWAGLKASERRWSGETVANAGVYLFQLGKVQDALALLLCAEGMGYRSPYLFEALATAYHRLGQRAKAREAIARAQQLLPDDRLIVAAASFIATGQPPPPEPPARDPHGLESALRELEEHAERALKLIKAQADALGRSLPDAHASQHYDAVAAFARSVVTGVREQADAARRTDATMSEAMVNGVLMGAASAYALITDALLSFPDTTSTSGSPLLFWSAVLGLDPPVLARESRREAVVWNMHGGGPALANGARDEYSRGKEDGYAAHSRRRSACRDQPCKIREEARWCGEWKKLYERWADASRQRHNIAAQRFDRFATRRLMQAENELLRARDYALRQLKKMRFRRVPGVDMEQMTLQTINQQLQLLYERHASGAAAGGTIQHVAQLASWFERERSGMEEQLSQEAQQIRTSCTPAMQALLELLAQEEWQAYRAHLRDRLAWSLQGRAESGEFPCEASVGPFTFGTDLERPGSGALDIKWGRKDAPYSITTSLKLSEDQSFGVGIGAGVSRGDDLNASSSTEGVGGGASYGPFAGKADVTLTSAVSPWNSREYRGIRVKGSAGLGIGSRAACYPSSGSVTFYPRAIFEDGIRYLSTPERRPR